MPVSKLLLKRREQFRNELETRGLIEKFEHFSQERHYPKGMLYDFLMRDHRDLCDGWTRKQIVYLLHRFGFRHNNKKYLKIPQEEKLRFRYPEAMSFEEIRAKQTERGRLGAKMTLELRRSWDNYNPKNTPLYWEKKGLSAEAAGRAAHEYRASKSPYSRHFVKYEGLSEQDVDDAIGNLAAQRGVKGLLAQQTLETSLQKMMRAALQERNVFFVEEKMLKTTKLERQEVPQRNIVYLYDFYLPERNVLIEANGTYWHADNRIYNASDEINYPSGTMLASERWEKEEIKLQFAKKRGFKMHVIWELDMLKKGFIQRFLSDLDV